MTNIEKLQLIRARCVELLALAEKRTQGQWTPDETTDRFVWMPNPKEDNLIKVYTAHAEGDKQFIAACAGAAEAGWRSTIAAIDGLLRIRDCGIGYRSPEAQHAQMDLDAILAAWPEELL